MSLISPWVFAMIHFCTVGRVSLATVILLFSSCGSAAGPKLHPVSGQVFYEDQPAVGATVVFHPLTTTTGEYRPGAVVGEDGTYTLRTYPHGDGAPEGDYVVLVTWFENPPPGKGDRGEVKSRLPIRYSDRDKSGLKATVKSGSNVIEPFRLAKRPK